MNKLQPTPEHIYLSRRRFIRTAMSVGILSTLPFSSSAKQSSELTVTAEKHATRYNNYYEFTTNKKHVHLVAADFNPEPWSLSVGGLVKNPMVFSMSQLPVSEERVFRFRCVEGWSMVVPWSGFSLHELLAQVEPKLEAKYVRFETVFRPSEMIGQRRPTLDWPYIEALRLDEAMHPLTTLATGMYQKKLPKQNGAPIRLIVPWKYGFKSIKAINKIELVSERPQTTWHKLAPEEYGFFANVNPEVSHPRWSQRREVPLGQLKKVRTLPFNGYADQVASLYDGMDLAHDF
ncbi:MAG: protein-methionine-sulfoxide reductase catalytic subunit MsrP [Oleiphilus sp.]